MVFLIIIRRAALGNLDKYATIISDRYLISAPYTTRDAPMYYRVIRARTFKGNRLHTSSARGGPIPWIHVDMLAPEASRAVVRIAITLGRGATVFAHKILHVFRKTH